MGVNMPLGDWILFFFISIPVIATLLPLSSGTHWTVRVFDFPRLQIAVMSILCMLLNYLFQQSSHLLFFAMEVINCLCAI